MAADYGWKLNTNNVVYLVHACYCSHLSFLSFCFSSISNFLSPTPSCLASPLLPLNWSQLSHSILSFSPLSGLLVVVGLSFDRIYGGPICASVGLCVSYWFLFFSFLFSRMMVVMQLWVCDLVAILVVGGCGFGWRWFWMGFVSNEFFFFFPHWSLVVEWVLWLVGCGGSWQWFSFSFFLVFGGGD